MTQTNGRPSRRRLMAGALAAGTSATLTATVATPALATPAVGKPAPKFTLWTFDHKRYNSADLLGNVVILNYWATWCGPCKQELPTINSWVHAYQQKYQRDDLKVFAITVDDTVSDSQLKPLARVLSFPLISRLDSFSYGMIDNAVPGNYVIGRDGTLRYARAGAFDFDLLNSVLPPLLSETVPDKMAPSGQQGA